MSLHQTIGPVVKTVTIANNTTTSNALKLEKGFVPWSLDIDTITGATFTFSSASTLTGTYRVISSGGSDYTVTATDDKHIILDPTKFGGCNFIKIISASAEGAERTITVNLNQL